MGGVRAGRAGPKGAGLDAAPPRASCGRPGGPGAPPTALWARLRRRERRILPPAGRGGERRGEEGRGAGPAGRGGEANRPRRDGPREVPLGAAAPVRSPRSSPEARRLPRIGARERAPSAPKPRESWRWQPK